MIRLISPENGAEFSVLTDTQAKLIRQTREGTFTRFGEYDEVYGVDASAPAVYLFRWRSDDADFPTYLEISETDDFSAEPTVDISETRLSATDRDLFSSVSNFLTGKTYFWRVRQNGEYSEVRSFSTAPDPVRPLLVDGVPNFRDLGGRFNADGRRMKQGLIYRGRFLERDEDERAGLTDSGKRTFAGRLGIKTEIDLREEEEGKRTESPAGPGVRYVQVSHDSSWGGTLNDRGMGQLHQIFDVLFVPASYPVYFHCYSGADRTGFISVVIGGIVGMSDENIIIDYNFTALYAHRNWNECEGAEGYFDFLRETYGDRSLSELVMLHLTNYGIDADKLARLKEFLLED
ncbi:MAG: tyrosine-protein phosphatase [Clostridia bacterium]|nr:tyrosine-protein phosphatase [Clostridia bacterium]